jgi:ribosomal protein S18 acetylase RimI-like enzyme
MARLRRLSAREYPRCEREIIEFYADECVRAGRIPRRKALAWATEDIRSDLKYGIETEDHWFYVIEKEKPRTSAGYIWLGRDDERENWAFLYIMLVRKEFRNQGLGKASLRLLEERLKEEGFKGINLHVHVFNEIACRLYRNMGYETNSLNMGKEIK